MSNKPDSVRFDIGKDVHGRTTTATRTRDYMGKEHWTIKTHASNQRDDDQEITCLTDEQILKLSEIVKDYPYG